jgi:hypothetical protein
MVFLQHPFYLLDGRRVLSLEDLVSEAADSIWPGMFQAEAGRGNTTSVKSTTDATSDTVAAMPYPMKKGQGKRFWTTGNEPQ